MLDIEVGAGGVQALVTDAGRMPVETLVVCGGVHSGELAAMLGEPVPIEAERGYHVTYSDPALQLPMPVHVSDAKVFVTPMEMGVRIAGQAEFAGIYAEPNYQRAEVLETHMKRMFPQRAHRRQHALDGAAAVHAGFAAGDRPVGEAAQRLLRASATGTWDCAAARRPGGFIADLVAGRKPAVDLAPYRVDRF